MGFVAGREAVGQFGWNKELSAKKKTIDYLKYGNYVREIYMASDTKIALLSNSPSDVPEAMSARTGGASCLISGIDVYSAQW